MAKAYYWYSKEGSGLLTEREKKLWILRYHMSEDDFALSDVEITANQQEYEAISEWFQRQDQNGSYTEIARELRDTREYCPYDNDFLRNLNGLTAVLCGWMSEDYETEGDLDLAHIAIMSRLMKLREAYLEEVSK